MKILALTSIRSDYDLMSSVYAKLQADPSIKLKLLVSGAHLSARYGHTVDNIVADGFAILERIASLTEGDDSAAARLVSASRMLQGAIEPVRAFAPDLIVYAGDREDVMVGALLGGFLGIPTLHFFGGDHAADGHIDNPLRHATSKLSTVHFVSVEEHKQRLLAIGEAASRIHLIGSVALDKFVQHALQPMSQIYDKLGIAEERRRAEHAVVIFHPIADEIGQAGAHLRDIVQSLLERGLFVFVSAPNTDPGNLGIIDTMEKIAGHPQVHCYKSLERDDFLSVFKQSRLIAGNSSAGILEAASVPVAAVNVGKRQFGRLASENVIFCETGRTAIDAAVDKALGKPFTSQLVGMRNIYGDGKSAARAVELIKSIDFSVLVKKKEDPLGGKL